MLTPTSMTTRLAVRVKNFINIFFVILTFENCLLQWLASTQISVVFSPMSRAGGSTVPRATPIRGDS
jgi:hypothetical protein